jgi:hypothetical protein
MNVRCALFMALSVLCAATATAQQGRRGFIGLDIGPSQPFGDFKRAAGRAGAGNARAGNARAGYTSTLLNVGWRRGPRWGIAGLFSYSEYLMRDNDGAENDWWQVAFLTAGPMYTVPLGNRAALDVKGTLGLAALTPVIDNYASDSDTAPGLAIDLRTTLRYDVATRWAVFAEGGVQATNTSGGTSASQKYRALIGGFGIAFRPQW